MGSPSLRFTKLFFHRFPHSGEGEKRGGHFEDDRLGLPGKRSIGISMETRKRWHKFLIVAVALLTLYNILPTVFFYSKPLKQPIEQTQATHIAKDIIQRVNELEGDSKEWLLAFCKLLHLKPQAVVLDPAHPQSVAVTFKNQEDAAIFRSYLNRAGALIPFVPNQLALASTNEPISNTVHVQRKIALHFAENDVASYFQFSKKWDENGMPTPLYKSLIFDRAAKLGLAIGGTSENGQRLTAIISQANTPERTEQCVHLAEQLLSFVKNFGETSDVTKRFFASFSQVDTAQRSSLIDQFAQTLDQTKDQIKLDRIELQSQASTLQSKGEFLETFQQQRLEQLLLQEKTLSDASALVKKHKSVFALGQTPWQAVAFAQELDKTFLDESKKGSCEQIISFAKRNPFIESMVIDWDSESIQLKLYADVETKKETSRSAFLYHEMAYLSRASGEQIGIKNGLFFIQLHELEGSDSFLLLSLAPIAQAKATAIQESLFAHWHPKHPDLQRDVFPIWDDATYAKLPAHEKKLGLLIHVPQREHQGEQTDLEGLHPGSIYVIAKGLDQILHKIQSVPASQDSNTFFSDFTQLKTLLQQNGLFGYPGSTLANHPSYSHDFIFEAENCFLPVITATRENFQAHGSKRYAYLELSNGLQRLLTQNKIDNQIHEDLLKWRDDFHSAQLKLGGASPFDVPRPTHNLVWSNLKLNCKKYFRGDDRKILHWGLDLSGGKTVQIALHDSSGQLVTGDAELKQGIEELYQRVNKMGVSEVSIRREGNLITLDFPGSQELAASELIKASSMYFHIVNEKFNELNPALASAADQFLQDVWNEAVVTGRKSPAEINQIAWRHVHGESTSSESIHPRSEAARTLYDNGLRLASPLASHKNNLFNDTLSEIVLLRGNDFTEWQGKTHPLLIVFHHFALEGANLKDVQAGYDQNRGNFLHFEIKGKESLPSGEKINPREDLYAWTSQFSKDKIAGTPYAAFSSNAGWRMAVLLNDTVITSPTLSYPVRDGGQIEGSFTQREVAQLEADLKAGSLSYTPRILSEKNVSPEIGVKERSFGILATGLALVLVIICMVSYYRFGGVVASCAVLFNLLLMWAILQNLGATLTLASIAGAILTLGMAVDANVLVFERLREEFAICGRLAPSMYAGYRKAFSAILDSNVTTIIAALVLLQFDSGPIKGFALTLIVGIVSSMFTALFMTRYFFSGWVQNPKHTKMTMAKLVHAVNFPFLKYAKIALITSSVLLLVGGYTFFEKRHSIMGMDFTGGYSLTLELKPQADYPYRAVIEKALLTSGVSSQDFQVRQLTPSHHIRLFLSKNLEQAGKPFHGLPHQIEVDHPTYAYETNPRIQWIVQSLAQSDVTVLPDSLVKLDQNWSAISGQLSNSMRNSALIGLGIALLCILAYISFRFEFTYALAAILCLAHDTAISLAFIALFYACGLPVQIDLNTIAALMTIIGYSLNDTIIVFDRIREDLRLMRKATLMEVIHHALNTTLSRTVMTSFTTLLVLLPLVFLGGSTIFAFSLIMIVGVVVGTVSSWFIAAPLLLFFESRQKQKEAAQIA